MKTIGLSLVLCGLAAAAMAQPAFTDRSRYAGILNPGDAEIAVQIIEVRGACSIDTINVRNTGTASAIHLTKVRISFSTSATSIPAGSPFVEKTLGPGDDLQAGIWLSPSPVFTVPATGSRYLWVQVWVGPPAAIEGGETVHLETNAYWYTATTSGSSGWKLDGRPEEILKAGFDEATDATPTPGVLNPGDIGPVHVVRLRDRDANAAGITVETILVRNAGSATHEDVGEIKLTVTVGATTYVQTKSATANWRDGGVEFPRAGFTPTTWNGEVVDEGEITVRVDVTVRDPTNGPPPRPSDGVTIQSELRFELTENADSTLTQQITAPTTWTIRRAGFEEVEEQSAPPPGLGCNPGDRVTQEIWLADSDYNTKGVRITSLWIRNLGTAETADISSVTIWVGATQAYSGGWPTGFNLRTGGWIGPTGFTSADVADERGVVVRIEYRVSPMAAPGRTFMPQVKVGHLEPPTGTYRYESAPADYPEEVTIYPAGFETVRNLDVPAATVYSTQRFVAQKIELADTDGNTTGVTITRIRVKNIGTAADAQFVKLEVRQAGDAGAILAETTALTGFRTAGITLTPTGNNVVADEGTAQIWIWLTLAGPAATVAGRTVRLETVFSFTEGPVSGDTSPVRGTTFEVGINNPPTVADFTWSPTSPSWEQEITFTPGTVTDPDGDAITYSRWDFGEGAQTRIVERNGPPETVRNRYPNGGTFNVTLTVRDARGLEGSKTKQISVTPRPNQAPVIGDITWTPPEPVVGQAVSFSATVTDPDTPPDAITAWAWDFGDGNTSTLQTPSHTYTAAGRFNVSLRVTDARGAQSALRTEEITVLPAAPNRRPEVGAITASPAVPEEGQQVTFTATATDPDGDTITAWEWDFNNDGTVDSTTPPPVRHTYARSGVYTIRVRASDAEGFGEPRTFTLYVRPKGGALIGTKLLDNPARTQARIQVFLPQGATGVKIQIFDMLGRPVLSADVVGGQYTWNLTDQAGRRIADGLYFYLVTATVAGKTERSEVGRILVVR